MEELQLAANMGRGGDTMIAHVTPGDVVIPASVVEEAPEMLVKLKSVMEKMGGDYRTHIAGHEANSINPNTGLPEYFFKKLKRIFKKAAPIIAPIAGATFLPGVLGVSGLLGGAIGSAAGTKIAGGDLGDALLAGAGSYGGGVLGNAIGSQNTLGSVLAKTANKPSVIGNLAEDIAVGLTKTGMGDVLTVPFGQVQGSFIGSQIGQSLKAAESQPAGAQSPAPVSFKPSRPESMGSPEGLSGMSALQQRAALATEGTQGGGLTGEQANYLRNLMQRNLITEGNQIDQSAEMLPVEQQYLSTLGVPTDNRSELLRILSQTQF